MRPSLLLQHDAAEYLSHSVMKTVLILLVVTLTGCASGHVGTRIGMDIPASGIGGTSNVTSTSSQLGFVGGLTFEGLFNRSWGIRADPQIRTVGGDIGFAGSVVSDNTILNATGVMTTDVTFLDMPVMAVFSPMDSGSSIHPFICIGAMLSATSSSTIRAAGTVTVADGSGFVSAPISSQQTRTGLGGPFVYMLFSGGIRIPISNSWELRAEARIQQLITDGDIANYTLYTSTYDTVARVTMSAPTTSLGVTVGMLFRL